MSGHIGEEKLALLAGGDLGGWRASGLARHLRECPDCAARLKSYREERRALAALRDTGIDAGDFDHVRQAVLTRLREEGAPHFRFHRFQWVALAAAILITVTVGTWWWTNVPAPQQAQLARPVSPHVEPPPAVSITQAAPIAKAAPGQAITTVRHVRATRQKPARTPAVPPIDIAGNVPAPPQPPLDDVVIKLETSDPNVIIIWLASPKGAGR